RRFVMTGLFQIGAGNFAATSVLIAQRKLHDSRIGRSLDLTKGLVHEDAVGLAEVHLVQEIEKLRAKLQLTEPLAEPKALDQRDIGIRQSRTAEEITSRGSVLARKVRGKRSGIEEFLNLRSPAGV